MSSIRPDQALLPSVLDRLLDDEPENRREAARSRVQLLRDLKKSVRRDLENLLNTRVRCAPSPPELKELKQSLVNYGVPDITGASLGTPKEREDFCRSIEKTIMVFDRRLKRLTVTLIDPNESADRVLRFQIEALLEAEPAPEPLVFDSTLRLTTATFEVKSKGDRDE